MSGISSWNGTILMNQKFKIAFNLSSLITTDMYCPCPSGRFHLSASRGRLDCLEVIISYGADLNVTDGAGRVILLSEYKFYLKSHGCPVTCAIDFFYKCLFITDSRMQRPSPRSQKRPFRVFKETLTGKTQNGSKARLISKSFTAVCCYFYFP